MADSPNVLVLGRKGRVGWICMRVRAEANTAEAVLATGTTGTSPRLSQLCAAVRRATQSMTLLILALPDDFLQHVKKLKWVMRA